MPCPRNGIQWLGTRLQISTPYPESIAQRFSEFGPSGHALYAQPRAGQVHRHGLGRGRARAWALHVGALCAPHVTLMGSPQQRRPTLHGKVWTDCWSLVLHATSLGRCYVPPRLWRLRLMIAQVSQASSRRHCLIMQLTLQVRARVLGAHPAHQSSLRSWRNLCAWAPAFRP